MTEGVQHKLLIKLLGYKFTVEYKKGKENKVADALSRKPNLLAISMAVPSWTDNIEQSYEHGYTCKNLIARITAGATDLPSYSYTAGILRYKGRIYVGNDEDFQQQLLSTFHSSPIGGHSRIRATYHRIHRIFHWPKLKAMVETFVQQCPVCQRSKGEHCHYPGLLDPLPIPDMAWRHISMDFVEGLPKSQGKDVI